MSPLRMVGALEVLADADKPLHGTRVAGILAERGFPGVRAHWTDGKGWQNTCHALVRQGLAREHFDTTPGRHGGSSFSITQSGRALLAAYPTSAILIATSPEGTS